MKPNKRRGPSNAPEEECFANGAEYYFEIERNSPFRRGRISDNQGTLCWRYSAHGRRSGRRLTNPFNKLDFVVENPRGQAELVIRRASFVPPVFQLLSASGVAGEIRMISILRNRYLILMDGANSLMFHMPLFTVVFLGRSESRVDIWARAGPSEREWSVLIRRGIDDSRLVAALAFIHHERWRYG